VSAVRFPSLGNHYLQENPLASLAGFFIVPNRFCASGFKSGKTFAWHHSDMTLIVSLVMHGQLCCFADMTGNIETDLSDTPDINHCSHS